MYIFKPSTRYFGSSICNNYIIKLFYKILNDKYYLNDKNVYFTHVKILTMHVIIISYIDFLSESDVWFIVFTSMSLLSTFFEVPTEIMDSR